MADSAFPQLRRMMQLPAGAVWQARIFGALSGLLFIGWIALVVLLVDLLIYDGTVQIKNQSTADFVADLTGLSAPVESTFEKFGLLHTVVQSRGRWSEPLFVWAYRNHDFTHRNLSWLTALMIAALSLGVFRILLAFGQRLAIIQASMRGSANLQRQLFQHKFTLGSQGFHPDLGSRITSLLREDVPRIEQAIRWWLELVPREVFRTVGLLAAALLLNRWLGLAFVLLAALIWILGSALLRRNMRRWRELGAAADAQMNRLLGVADKLRLIKGYAADKYFQESFGANLDKRQEQLSRRLGYEARSLPIWSILGLLLALGVVGLAGHNVLTDKFGMASAVGVFACLVGVAYSGGQWFWSRSAFGAAESSARRIKAFLDETSENAQIDGAVFLSSLSSAVELHDVTYRDAVGRTVLHDVSMSIPFGRRIALLATDDAEARAFADLLNRFVEPTRGTIKFDGQDHRGLTLESLRAQVCLVLQGDLLFPDTVANNIGCGDPGYSRERIIEAAKVAHAHNFIERLPHGYECVVGEQGFPIRAGESYRIGLARAILRDPSLVVLEEPAGPMDGDTESVLDDTLTRFLRRRTAVILPRRLATLQHCDYTVVLDKGRIIAHGAHNDLYANSPIYRFLLLTRFYGGD